MNYKYFTVQEYTKGREVANPLSKEQEENMHNLLAVLDQFREKYGKPLKISSGYRPAAQNAAVGGAKKSNHIQCLAVDFVDDEKQTLGKWCLVNLNILEELGLYMEDLRHTKNWVHLQIVGPKSGKRIFIP
jgi:zinc D-Ala-D-Ala carboxypeptidase